MLQTAQNNLCFSSETVHFSFAISDLLTISSRALQSEHYTSGTVGLEVLHKCYNTDVLGVLLIYPHYPSGAARPWESWVYISQTPRGRVITY